MKPPIVEAEWTDAVDVNEQCPLSEVAKVAQLARRITCGYLVLEDAERIVLAHDFDPPDAVGNLTVIPRGWVHKITRKTQRRSSALPARALRPLHTNGAAEPAS